MRPIICLLLFFAISIQIVSAQVPGYRGKKVILKLNMKGMPVSGFLISDEKFYDFNFRFSGGIGVVLSKSITMGVSLEQVNDIILLEKYTVSPQYPINSSWGDGKPTSYKSAANFYGYSYGANLKFFSYKSSGSLAPFGRFTILEYLYNKISITDDGRFYSSGKRDLNDFQSHTFIIGMGSQKIYFNRITFEGNVKLGLNTYGIKALKKGVDLINQDEVYRSSTSKMFSDFLITAGIGIGFLAF